MYLVNLTPWLMSLCSAPWVLQVCCTPLVGCRYLYSDRVGKIVLFVSLYIKVKLILDNLKIGLWEQNMFYMHSIKTKFRKEKEKEIQNGTFFSDSFYNLWVSAYIYLCPVTADPKKWTKIDALPIFYLDYW